MQRGAVMMDDFPASGGIAGVISTALIVIAYGVHKARGMMSRDRRDRAGDDASFSVIRMQSEQIERDRQHILQLTAALQESHRQMQGMRVEMAEMSQRIDSLERRLREHGDTP